MLLSGSVDAALAPAIEYFRLSAEHGERVRGPARGGLADLVALPVAAVVSRGAVGSVRLFGYAEPEKVRRVLLDSASRTSNVMARLILTRKWGIRPHFVLPEEVGPNPPREPDAELLIGDAALKAVRPKALWERDLGLEWDQMTHLPFVYAFWMARRKAPIGRLIEVLSAARDAGLAQLEELAAEGARRLGIDPAAARRYLTHQIRYDFGPKERRGLHVFYEMAAEDGMAPVGVPLRFAPAT
jgi:predicted solute-binding protein